MRAAASSFHGQQRIALSDGITPSRLPTFAGAYAGRRSPKSSCACSRCLSQSGCTDNLYDPEGQSGEVGGGIVAKRCFGATPSWSRGAVWHPLLKTFGNISWTRCCVIRWCRVTHMHAGVMRQINRCCGGWKQEPVIAERVACGNLELVEVYRLDRG